MSTTDEHLDNLFDNESLIDRLAKTVNWTPPEGDEDLVDISWEPIGDEVPGIGDS